MSGGTNETSGQLQVVPAESGVYLGICELAGEIGIGSVWLSVTGSKGTDEWWPEAITGSSPVRVGGPVRFVDAVERAEARLGARNFPLRRSIDGANAVLLETGFSENIAPPHQTESELRARRVAYRVRIVHDPGGSNYFEVWVLVQKRLRLESRWREDGSSSVRDAALSVIRQMLANPTE
jgi:hypothetical protein